MHISWISVFENILFFPLLFNPPLQVAVEMRSSVLPHGTGSLFSKHNFAVPSASLLGQADVLTSPAFKLSLSSACWKSPFECLQAVCISHLLPLVSPDCGLCSSLLCISCAKSSFICHHTVPSRLFFFKLPSIIFQELQEMKGRSHYTQGVPLNWTC